MDIGDCSPVFVLSPMMASGGGSDGGGGTGGFATGVLGGCEASQLFLSSSFVSFETELMLELELLSGSAVSAVGVDDLPETSTISCVVKNGALIGKKRPGSTPNSFRMSDHIEWR